MKKQVSFRMDNSEYIELRGLLLREGKTFQEYMMELIKRDMEVRGENEGKGQ